LPYPGAAEGDSRARRALLAARRRNARARQGRRHSVRRDPVGRGPISRRST